MSFYTQLATEHITHSCTHSRPPPPSLTYTLRLIPSLLMFKRYSKLLRQPRAEVR